MASINAYAYCSSHHNDRRLFLDMKKGDLVNLEEVNVVAHAAEAVYSMSCLSATVSVKPSAQYLQRALCSTGVTSAKRLGW
jgi:hypothetical protein